MAFFVVALNIQIECWKDHYFEVFLKPGSFAKIMIWQAKDEMLPTFTKKNLLASTFSRHLTV